jgi:hypothetical protein
MTPNEEYSALRDVIAWINEHAVNIELPIDERSLIAQGCFDVAIEHQAAISFLHSVHLHGSMLALMRVLAESLVRGLWLMQCATEIELARFKNRGIDKEFGTLIEEIEVRTSNRALSNLKSTAWKAMNDFTHTGFNQVARRHGPGSVGANYPEEEIAEALSVAGALGLIAAGGLIAMTGKAELADAAIDRMEQYATRAERASAGRNL